MPVDRSEAIRACHLFAEADEATLANLARRSSITRHAAGGAVFMAGDEADGLRVVLEGLVRIWIADDEGRELTLALLEPGEPFGEIALLDGLPRTANATAAEATTCLLTPADAFDAALSADSKLARQVIRLLCEILRRNTEAMGSFAFLGLDARLAQKLHDLAMVHATLDGAAARFTRRFSQTDLARMLGVTREAVNKRLSALAHDGLIQLEDGLFRIPDLGELAERARSAQSLSRR